MTTFADVRDNLATICSGITGWTGSGYVGDSVNANVIKVTSPAFDPRMVLSGGKCRHTFRAIAYAPRTAGEYSEQALDVLRDVTGTGSLLVAVQNGSNWTVTVDYAQVTEIGEVQLTTFGQDTTEYLTCPFLIEVVWKWHSLLVSIRASSSGRSAGRCTRGRCPRWCQPSRSTCPAWRT